MISSITRCNEAPIYMEGRPQEVKHATCSAEKAKKLLNYTPNSDLLMMIKSTVEYIKLRGPKPFNYNLPVEIINEKTPKTWKDGLM